MAICTLRKTKNVLSKIDKAIEGRGGNCEGKDIYQMNGVSLLMTVGN